MKWTPSLITFQITMSWLDFHVTLDIFLHYAAIKSYNFPLINLSPFYELALIFLTLLCFLKHCTWPIVSILSARRWSVCLWLVFENGMETSMFTDGGKVLKKRIWFTHCNNDQPQVCQTIEMNTKTGTRHRRGLLNIMMCCRIDDVQSPNLKCLSA